MAFDATPLGELMGDKGYIRGPFGSALKRAELKENGIPVYEQQHAIDGVRTFRYFIDDDKYSELRRFTVEPNDLIISCSGTVGRISVIQADDPKGIISQALLILRPDTDKVLPYYLYYFLTSTVGAQELVNASQGAVQLNIAPRNIVEKIPIPLPADIKVQRGIVKQLKVIDDKIDLNRRINQNLEAMAQAIFKSWFVDFDPVKAKIAAKAEGRDPLHAAMSVISGKPMAELDTLPPEAFKQLAATAALFTDEMEESELGEIPKGWAYKALALLTDKIGSGSTPRGGKEVYLEEGVALIRSQNVYDSSFVWEGLARISDDAATQLKGVTVQDNDVLLNITGASILRTCVVEPEALPARVNQHVAIIRANAGVPPRFIHLHLLRPDIKNYLLGLNAGASREAITKAHIENLTLLTPGAELLRAFQIATDPLFRQMQRFAHQVRVLGELRDTLLPKLLSGELAVADVDA